MIAPMFSEPGRWCRLIPAVIAGLPETPGVFEVGSLVRNVLFIGRADGSLRERMTSLIQTQEKLPPSSGGYYFRYELATDEEDALGKRLSAYQDGHAGLLPPANRAVLPTVTPRRAAA
jgi:hypothetical protein